MHETTIWIDGREHRLIPRTTEEPDTQWARSLIDDPTQQHIVHLLAWRCVEHVPGRDHREVMAELEIELSLRFVAVEMLAAVA